MRFGLGGAEYEIDLSKNNAVAFRRKLAPFIDHAARPGEDSTAGRGGPRRAVSAAAGSGHGASPGITVSARGRIPASVVEQYEAAANGS